MPEFSGNELDQIGRELYTAYYSGVTMKGLAGMVWDRCTIHIGSKQIWVILTMYARMVQVRHILSGDLKARMRIDSRRKPRLSRPS